MYEIDATGRVQSGIACLRARGFDLGCQVACGEAEYAHELTEVKEGLAPKVCLKLLAKAHTVEALVEQLTAPSDAWSLLRSAADAAVEGELASVSDELVVPAEANVADEKVVVLTVDELLGAWQLRQFKALPAVNESWPGLRPLRNGKFELLARRAAIHTALFNVCKKFEKVVQTESMLVLLAKPKPDVRALGVFCLFLVLRLVCSSSLQANYVRLNASDCQISPKICC